MRLRVCNQTAELRALRLSFSENDAFLFCGLKLFHFRLPPRFAHTLAFNLLPIKTGAVMLPTPKLLDVSSNTEVFDSQTKSRVYVRPGETKGGAWEGSGAAAAGVQSA